MLVDHKYTKKETYKTVYTSTLTYLDFLAGALICCMEKSSA